MFRGAPLGCADAADANDDEGIDVADSIFVLEYIFRQGDKPPQPFPDRGLDGAGEALDCGVGI